MSTEPTAQAPPTIGGEMHPPAGRRTCWLLLVRYCPHCRHLHAHRVPSPCAGAYTRRGSCGGVYRVVATPLEV